MQQAEKNLVIVGDGEFAEIACEYFTYDSPYRVVAFAVETYFLKKKELFGLPVVPFEELQGLYAPAEHSVFVAISFAQLNRLRTRLYQEAKRKGYAAASYVSSKAFVWGNVEIGEHCFIFENNIVQYRVTVGNNVILWSGNHVGHRTRIGENSFVASHVVISGFCDVGESCFLGVNTSVADGVKIGRDCVTGVGTVVTEDLEEGKVYVGSPARPTGKSSYSAFGLTGP